MVASLKYRREKAAALGIEFAPGGEGAAPTTTNSKSAKDSEIAKENRELKKQLAQSRREIAIANGQDPPDEEEEGFYSDEETATAVEPEPKVNLVQIQASINRAKGQLEMGKQETLPDEDLIKKFEARIEAYEAKIIEATPPDKRAK